MIEAHMDIIEIEDSFKTNNKKIYEFDKAILNTDKTKNYRDSQTS